MEGELTKEYLLFLSREEINRAKGNAEIKIEKQAQDIITATNSPNDIFAIYYTNPDIRIIKAELITKENFADFLKI